MKEHPIWKFLEASGAILDQEGLKLASGRCTDRKIEIDPLFKNPRAVAELKKELCLDLPGLPQVIIGPADGGNKLACLLHDALSKEYPNNNFLFVETRKKEGGGFTLVRDNQQLSRVLIVDDVWTTGGSVRELVTAIKEVGGEIIGCIVIVNRSGQPMSLPCIPTHALLDLNTPALVERYGLETYVH